MAAPLPRHYGMDWLRIGAFAVLILYHVGMVFVPWGFHAKSRHVADWLTLPMLAVNAWRLSLLFVVSGYASRALLARSTGTVAFVKNRSSRLLVPLLFGIVVIVPPQPWVELVTQHGYTAGFWSFWIHDYFRFAALDGVNVPTWNHLWFVAYLWVYTLLLVAGRRLRLQPLFDRVFGGIGVVAWPMLWLVCVHGWWLPMAAETHALVDDPVAHASYLPAFLFGFGLAGSRPAMAAIVRWWRPAAALALAGYAGIVGVELAYADAPRWLHPAYGALHAVQQWGGIVALVGIAETWWNRDHRWRPILTEAIFPFYLIHQTIIVVAAWALRPAALPGWAEFAMLVAATVIGCWGFYLVGRRIGWLRPLIGLRPRVAPPPRSAIGAGA